MDVFDFIFEHIDAIEVTNASCGGGPLIYSVDDVRELLKNLRKRWEEYDQNHQSN